MKEKNNEITIGISPFENLAGKSGEEFLCKSLYLDLITELSRFRQFRIIARENDPGVSDESDNPTYQIRGSLRIDDSCVRINARLIRSRSEEIVWADHFKGNKESVQSIQQLLLERLAATLQQQLNYDLLNQARRRATNPSAYEFWLCGMEELKNGTVEADERAREYFNRAIEIDPTYSLAYSGMSLSFFNEWSCQLWERWDNSREGAFEWAKRAIELDSQNYIAAMVLGRAYMYEGDWDLSEHYFRHALSLNPNDVDCLVQVASGFIFVGYADEADELYERVLQLNSVNVGRYRHIGAVIALERGDFCKSIELGRYGLTPWLDFDAFLAAAYYHAGDTLNMRQSWQKFLEKFEARIHKQPIDNVGQAVNWLRLVNPYKGESNFYKFLDHIGAGEAIEETTCLTSNEHATFQRSNCIARRNGFWEITYQGSLARVIELKGLNDIATLLQSPGNEFHCTELMGAAVQSEGEDLLDPKAKQAYRRRLQQLRDEIAEKEELHDHEGKATLQREYDALLAHLSACLGLGGKTRKTNDTVDKVRSAVTWRIRKAIRVLEQENAGLARHLNASIKTGVFCSYRPEIPQEWDVRI